MNSLTKGNSSFNNVEEELDYEYSDDEDEIVEFCSSSSEPPSPSSAFCEADDSNDGQIQARPRRINISAKDKSSHQLKKRWKYRVSGYLKRWRIRSFDQVFSVHRGTGTNKLQEWVKTQKPVSTEVEVDAKEIESLSFFSIVINNDLCSDSGANELASSKPNPKEAKQVPYKTWDPWQPLPFSLFP